MESTRGTNPTVAVTAESGSPSGIPTSITWGRTKGGWLHPFKSVYCVTRSLRQWNASGPTKESTICKMGSSSTVEEGEMKVVAVEEGAVVGLLVKETLIVAEVVTVAKFVGRLLCEKCGGPGIIFPTLGRTAFGVSFVAAFYLTNRAIVCIMNRIKCRIKN